MLATTISVTHRAVRYRSSANASRFSGLPFAGFVAINERRKVIVIEHDGVGAAIDC